MIISGSNIVIGGPKQAKQIWLKASQIQPDPITGKYRCPTCDRSYGRPSYMMEHYRFSCRRPRYFKCIYCGKLIVDKSNFRKHMRRRHPQRPEKFEVIQTEQF